jgi:hypothetical protein
LDRTRAAAVEKQTISRLSYDTAMIINVNNHHEQQIVFLKLQWRFSAQSRLRNYESGYTILWLEATWLYRVTTRIWQVRYQSRCKQIYVKSITTDFKIWMTRTPPPFMTKMAVILNWRMI